MARPPNKAHKKALTRGRDWKPLFLNTLAACGVVSVACDAAGIERGTAYDHRTKFAPFRKGWKAALAKATDEMESEARRRAMEGVDEDVFHQGLPVGKIKKYSDTLLIFLMKGARPKKYRDNVRLEQSGSVTHDHKHEFHTLMDRAATDAATGEMFDAIADRLNPIALGNTSQN